VNFNRLSNERKKAYNDAKMYLQQAEDALKQGNFVFAQNIANKAESLARELAGK
jgi:phage shock protein A